MQAHRNDQACPCRSSSAEHQLQSTDHAACCSIAPDICALSSCNAFCKGPGILGEAKVKPCLPRSIQYASTAVSLLHCKLTLIHEHCMRSMGPLSSFTDPASLTLASPMQITYSSDYFTELHQFAVQLIKRGCAYVDHQTAEEVKQYR